MTKLELKHIAPYLPYGLKVNTPDNELYLIDFANKRMESKFRGHLINIYEWDEIKPILRPLSDLTQQMPECEGSYAEVLATLLEDIWFNDEYSQHQFCYELANGIIQLSLKRSKTVLDFLYRNHFDVEAYFSHGKGLLDAGLAISYKEAEL